MVELVVPFRYLRELQKLSPWMALVLFMFHMGTYSIMAFWFCGYCIQRYILNDVPSQIII